MTPHLTVLAGSVQIFPQARREQNPVPFQVGEYPSLQMGIHGLIHHITHSPTLLKYDLLAIDNTSPKELANVALSRVMGLATDSFLTFL